MRCARENEPLKASSKSPVPIICVASLLLCSETSSRDAVLSLRTVHDSREQNNQLKMRGGSLALIAASIFLTFGEACVLLVVQLGMHCLTQDVSIF